MQKFLRINIVLGFIGLSLLPFTNCGKYADPANEELYSENLEACDDDCIMPKPDYLSIKVNVGGGSQYDVPTGLAEWNLGGDCNEGGYPHNTIRWELKLNGTTVRHSGMTGMSGNTPVNSRCVNGRFLLYINLSSIPQDPVNRTGLMTGAGSPRTSYDLYVEIVGQNVPNDPEPIRNPTKARTRISLTAI